MRIIQGPPGAPGYRGDSGPKGRPVRNSKLISKCD